MSAVDLRDRNVLVVGASAGIGRAVAMGAARAGARTVLAARRRDALEDVVAEVGGVAVAADVAEPGAAARLVAEAVDAVGRLDLAVVAVGTGRLVPMIDADPELWWEVLGTNLVGLTQVVRAVVPALAPNAIVVALSSEIVGRARHSMGIYGASKAALDQTFLGWQVEHPDTRFSRVTLGATQPTDFGSSLDAERLGPALEEWVRRGEMQRRFMHVDEVAAVLLGVLATALANPSVGIEHIRLRSPSDTAGSLGDIEF